MATPVAIKAIAAQNVEVMGSPNMKYAQVVVVTGMKLLFGQQKLWVDSLGSGRRPKL